MSSINDITGDSIKSKAPNAKYSDGWDRIFGKDKNKVFDELAKNYTPDPDISKALDDNVDMIPSDTSLDYLHCFKEKQDCLLDNGSKDKTK